MRKTALLMPAPMYHDAPTADLLLSRLKPVAGGVRRVAGARPEGCRSARLLMALAALASGIPAVATEPPTPDGIAAGSASPGPSAPSRGTENPPAASAEPPSPIVIMEGQVINHIGAGHANVTVTVHRQRQDGTKGDLIATVATDEIGDFAVTAPEAIQETVIVTFSAPNYTDLVRTIRLGEGEQPPYLAEQLEGSLAVTGRILSALADQPIAGASVSLRSVYRDWQAKTDKEGHFAIQGVTPGQGELVVEASGFGREVHRLADLEAAGEIVVRVKPERVIHLRIVDENDKPIPAVTVEVHDEPRGDYRTYVTDEDGVTTMRRVHFDAQFIQLRLTHDDYISSEGFDREIVTPAGQTESRHGLVMTRAGRISGKVVDDHTNQPLNGARLLTGTAYANYSPRDWTDYQGMYTIKGVRPGRVVVTVHLFGYAPDLKAVEVHAGETTSLDVGLEPGATLEGIVTTESGQPVRGVQVETGRWRGHTTLSLRAMTDELGRFVIENTPHDEFEIVVALPGGKNVAKMVQVQPNRKVQLVTADPLARPKIGDFVPALRLSTLDGVSLDLAQLKGKIILLDFWATWSGPCIAELPELAATYDQFGSRDDFVMIGISLDEKEPELREFVRRREVKWHQVLGAQGGADAAAQGLGVLGEPRVFIIGRDGRITAAGIRGTEARDEIKRMLGKNGS